MRVEQHSAALAAQVAWDSRAGFSLGAAAQKSEAWLWIDRHFDGFPNLRVERLGRVAWVLRYQEQIAPLPEAFLQALAEVGQLEAILEQHRPRRGARSPSRVVWGSLSEPRFQVRELGASYWLDAEASSTSSGWGV